MLWKGFQKPKRLIVTNDGTADRFSQFSAQPFERGFGTTVGNSLRRALQILTMRRLAAGRISLSYPACFTERH